MLYSDEQIRKAYNVNLVDYFKNNGYICEKKEKDRTHVRGFNGLIIKDDNSFYCFGNSNIQGNNPIKCLQGLFNMKFQEAVKALINEDPILENIPNYKYNGNSNNGKNNTSYNKTDKSDNQNSVLVKKETTKLVMPEKATDYKRVYSYLTQTRKINPKIISELFKKELLYQEKEKNNAVFVHLDNDGKQCGAEIIGTLSDRKFRRVAEGTHESVFTIAKGETTNTAYVFESAIDALSFFQLHPEIENGKFISMAGLKDFAIKQLSNENLKIISCVDNDKAGEQFNERHINNPEIKNFTVNNECKINNVKDHNELLILKLSEKENENSIVEPIINKPKRNGYDER